MKCFDYETRVRYGETDQMGISYYANYFVWFEAARTEYFRALGFVYSEFEKQCIFLPVAEDLIVGFHQTYGYIIMNFCIK